MPTPDPSLIPEMFGTISAIFTDNWETVLGAVVGLVALITVPVLLARGGLTWAIGGIRKLFKRA